MFPAQDTRIAFEPRIYGVSGKTDRMDRTDSCLFSLLLQARSFLLDAVRSAAVATRNGLRKKEKDPGKELLSPFKGQ
ncbi:hypothetical protein V0R50_01655 [Pseudomonas sp. 148P]|uniref:Uncharacterized protein n=1 Tax=Pseudomonas ulcerans TaxID=3115852 RepID=A0ABU7HK65_9PSED|nr:MULTISPECIES: hypothetical protein [unclassified Pseudomonas]MEE1922266.1 hypothetical protein [Pseudomonas sp. 147P]MEE1931911.1 hypothetical protein [Pseudomonas sp. 148P]